MAAPAVQSTGNGTGEGNGQSSGSNHRNASRKPKADQSQLPCFKYLRNNSCTTPCPEGRQHRQLVGGKANADFAVWSARQKADTRQHSLAAPGKGLMVCFSWHKKGECPRGDQCRFKDTHLDKYKPGGSEHEQVKPAVNGGQAKGRTASRGNSPHPSNGQKKGKR